LSDNIGLLLLCEVAAKPFYEQLKANYTADEDCKADKKLFVISPYPDFPRDLPNKSDVSGARKELVELSLSNGRTPATPSKDVSPPGAHLLYNEVSGLF